jgi:glycosyltransferase involved in cell wall biosynthesis
MIRTVPPIPSSVGGPDGPPLRVLHVVQKFSSGVGAAVAQYTHSLPGAEHHLLSGTPVVAEGDLAEQADFAGVIRMTGSHLEKVGRVRRAVHELRPDVVHGHSSHGGAYARLAVARRRQYVVYTPHCYAFERRDVPAPVRAAFWALEALLAVNTSAFAACSPREWRLSAWPTRRAPRYVVPNIAHADGRPAVRRTGPPTVAGGGRLSPQKDPVYFLAAVERLRVRVPGLRAVWLGDGDAAFRAPLERAAVEVTGWLPRRGVLERLGAANLYLHSARWEGFPLMVAEAVALNVPTVVRRAPSFEDVPDELTLAGTDLANAVACLRDPGAAAANLATWARVLAHNTVADQQRALLDVYLRRPPHRLPSLGG